MSKCLIQVGKSGKYCALGTRGPADELLHMDLNEGALILKAANLPATDVLMQVGNEWVASGQRIGGSDSCTVICKPGCYKLDIAFSDYEGVEAPAVDPVELCFEVDKAYDKMGALLETMGSNEIGNTGLLEAIQDCLDEMKLLVAANNDATVLAAITAQLMELCDKLLAQSDQLENILTDIQAGNAAQLQCLEDLKELPQPLIPLSHHCY